MDILIYALAIFVCWYGFRSPLVSGIPQPYGGRSCQGQHWRRAFPNSENTTTRTYLECFVDGMAFSSKHRLKFCPADRVLDVYRSIYGGETPFGDNLECETFLDNVSHSFDVELEHLYSIWHEELTLRELYGRVLSRHNE